MIEKQGAGAHQVEAVKAEQPNDPIYQMELLDMSIRHNEQVNEYMYPRKVEQHMTGGQSISVSGEDASVGGSRTVLVS